MRFYHPYSLAAKCLSQTFAALYLAVSLFTTAEAAGTLPGQDPLPNISLPRTLEFWTEVDEAAPSITLKFLYTEQEANIYRREHGQSAWNVVASNLASGTTEWTDSNVIVGQPYEYIIERDTIAGSSVGNEYGYTLAGIQVDQATHRGTLILILAENIVSHNASRIEQLYQDLVGDGWKVETVYAPYFNRNPFEDKGDVFDQTNGMWGHRYPAILRNRIREIYAEDPNGVKLIYFLGHTPMALTGTFISNEDGHGWRGYNPADHYYADIDGVWTDNNTNLSSQQDVLTALHHTIPNMKGDGIWDPNLMPSEVELGFGRVDPWDRKGDDWFTPALTEAERVARYLDKAHKYRHVQDFGFPGEEAAAGRKAMMRGPTGQEGANHASAQFLNYVGPSQMDDFIQTHHLPTPTPPISNGDIQVTVNQGPYLFWGQTTQGPTNNDKYRKSVFNHGMQSWWSEWHSVEQMRKATMDENMVLSWLYAGWHKGELFNQAMGLGVPIGQAMLTTMNDASVEALLGPIGAGSQPAIKDEFYRVLMADPALRIFMVPGVSNLSATPNGGNVDLSWSAPSDMSEFFEYRVWRASDTMGDFQMIASGLTNPTYTDVAAPNGSKTYMVQAVHLVTGGSGSFLSNSQGAFVEVGLSMDTYLVSPFPVGKGSAFPFTASNVSGAADWSVASGQLPDGVTLASDGTLSGTPVVPGEYPVRIRVSDATNTVERDFVVFVDAAYTEVVDMDLRQSGGLGLYDRAMPTRPISLIGDAQLDAVEGMVFDGNGDALRLHNIGEISTFEGGSELMNLIAEDKIGTVQWPDFSYTPAGAPFAVALSFKAAPASQGGVLIAKSRSSDPINQNQFTVMMLSDGKIQGSVRHISPIVSSASYNDGQWHSLVYTYDKSLSKVRLFIDGVLSGEGTYSKVNVADDLLVGARWDGPGEAAVVDSFNGSIADLKVFASEVKDEEAAAIHDRLVKTRGDLNPQAPSISGLPALIEVTSGTAFTFPLNVSDANGEPLRLYAQFEHPDAIYHSEFVKTASGYEWKVIAGESFAFTSSVTIGVDDGYPGHVATQTVQFNYAGPVNDSYSLSATGPHDLDVLANDQFAVGHTHVIDAIVAQPTYADTSLSSEQVGAVEIVGGKIRFYPAAIWNDPVVFIYALRDTVTGLTDTATVTLTPANVPQAVDDAFFLSTPGTVSLDALANDVDPSSEALEIIKITQPIFGEAVINGNNIDISNTDEANIMYTIRNESGFTSTASLLFHRAAAVPQLGDFQMEEGSGTALSNNGTLGGGLSGALSASVTWVDAILGKAVTLAGQHIDFGNPAALNFNPSMDSFSVTLDFETSQFRAGTTTYPMTLISKESGSGGDAQLAVVLEQINADKSVSVYIKGERVVVNEVEPYAFENYENIFDLNQAENALRWGHPDDALKPWHHFALINDATNKRLKVYIDQWLLADVDTSGMDINQGDNGGDWLIGASPDGAGGFEHHLQAAVDNIRFYDGAIDEAQLKLTFSELNFNMRKMAPVFYAPYPAPGTPIEKNTDYVFSLQQSVALPDPGETGILRSTGLERTASEPTMTWGATLVDINDPAWPIPGLTTFTLASGDGGIGSFNTPFSATHIEMSYSQTLASFDQNSGVYVNGPTHLAAFEYPIVGSASAIADALAIDTASDLGNYPANASLNIALQASGGSPAYTWSLSGAIPPGLSINAGTGALSGTPTIANRYRFTVDVSESGGQSVSKSFTMTVDPADSDTDKIADDWEMAQLGTLGAAITDDGDGDGLNLMQEYVLGLNAAQSSPGAYLLGLTETKGPISGGDDRYISFEYTRRSSLPNHSVSVESSPDMLNWSAVSATEVIIEDNGTIQKVRVDVPKDTLDTLFLRLKVSEL